MQRFSDVEIELFLGFVSLVIQQPCSRVLALCVACAGYLLSHPCSGLAVEGRGRAAHSGSALVPDLGRVRECLLALRFSVLML